MDRNRLSISALANSVSPNNTLTHNALLLLWVSLMASSFVISEDLLPYANPIASTGLRLILASVLMLPFAWMQKNLPMGFKVLWQYTLISLFLVLFFIGLFEALKTTSPMRTSVIYTLVPLLSVLLTYVGLKLKTSKSKLLGFFLGTGGAIWVLLMFNQNELQWFQWNRGDSIFLLACCCLALHIVLIKKWGAEVPPVQGAFYIMVLGGLLLLPFLILFGELEQVAWAQIKFWQILLYLTVFATMATFFLQQYLVKELGPNRLLAFTYLIPVLVVIPQGAGAATQLWNSLPGILITLIALVLISRSRGETE